MLNLAFNLANRELPLRLVCYRPCADIERSCLVARAFTTSNRRRDEVLLGL